MPWEITIVASEDQRQPLGQREDVISRFAAALPGITLERSPVPPPHILAIMPPVIRESALRPKLEATFESDELHVKFYANDLPVLHRIVAEVRGNGDPLPILAALCVPSNWMVINDADKSVVDLSDDGSPAWHRFRDYRDKAIRSLSSGTPGE